MRTFVIGDIHGCLDELQTLVGTIKGLVKDEESHLIFLGDYIDRGPDSSGVVDYLMKLPSEWNGYVDCLMGNHEDMYNQTTYGVGKYDDNVNLMEDQERWIRNRPKWYEDEKFICVHGVAYPDYSLTDHREMVLLWSRYKPEQDSGWASRGKVLYHGHTPVSYVELRKDRVNLDTACVFGGELTAAEVGNDGHPVLFVAVKNGTKKVRFYTHPLDI